VSQELSWGLWIAISASLVGAGTFLDRFHVSDDQRNIFRGFLIKCFVYLEKPVIPDYSKACFSFVFKIWKAWRYLGFIAFIFLLYVFIISAFYIGRVFLEDPPEHGYLIYVLNWLSLDENPFYWGGVLLWGIGLGFLSIYVVSILLKRINLHESVLPQLGWSFLANIAAYLFVFVGFMSAFTLFSAGPDAYTIPASGPMMSMSPFILALSFTVVLPSILWVGLIGNLIFLRLISKIIRSVLLNIFDVASDPKHSPFTYVCSLAGVLILAMKVLVEVSK
jgi:hypothetical protein